MGFFKKIFGRGRGGKSKKKKQKKNEGAFPPSNPIGHQSSDEMRRMPKFSSPNAAYPTFHTPDIVPSDSKSKKSKGSKSTISSNVRSRDSSYGSSFDSREETYSRTNQNHGQSHIRSPQAADDHFGNGDMFQADFSAFDNQNNNFTNQEPMTNNVLNYDRVQQFNMGQGQQHAGSFNYTNGHQPNKKLQLTRLPNGQLVPMNAGSSPMSVSSEFNLSTDAEDNEYNKIRKYDAHGNLLGSPTSDISEEGMVLHSGQSLPERQTSRKNSLYMSNSESEYESFKDPHNRSKHYFSDSDHDVTSPASRASANGDHFSPPQANGDHFSPPPANGDHFSPPQQTGGAKFTFDSEYDVSMSMSRSKSRESTEQREMALSQKSTSPSRESQPDGPSPRTLAIQEAQKIRAENKYPDSTDSENDSMDQNESPHMETITPSNMQRPMTANTTEGIIENFVDFENNAFDSRPFKAGSKSLADASSPVSELLAKAKKRRDNKRGNASSVTSAPNTNDFNSRRHVPRPNNTASAAAREKLQKRQMEKKEWLKNNNGTSDDDSDNGQDNESWLYNEVSGALGPKGIQADLESLGERSHRSKNSHRSHRSHRSSSRRARRSDSSVGSRHSRSSRASRYSVKSTKSHLSQMSVESRSVANDLIRLEMQLAMIDKSGENAVKKDLEMEAKRKGITGLTVVRNGSTGGSVGPGSVGGHSRSSSRQRSHSTNRARPLIPKRFKSTINAPPGKLGIILANKNDAKGTVVSGVRTTSVLADKISPGDRIVAIDGEDVSRMTVTEITAIMSRKSDFERVLTVLTTPK